MHLLTQILTSDQNIRGQPRKAGDDRKRVTDSVSAAIRRAIKDIAAEDPVMAEHLSSPRLKRGQNPIYDPQDDNIEWSTDPP
jgi:hypothetical protein